MARATKRTTSLLTAVAVIFIIVIIILCIVPQPCRPGDQCYAGTQRHGGTIAPVLTEDPTTTAATTFSTSDSTTEREAETTTSSTKGSTEVPKTTETTTEETLPRTETTEPRTEKYTTQFTTETEATTSVIKMETTDTATETTEVVTETDSNDLTTTAEATAAATDIATETTTAEITTEVTTEEMTTTTEHTFTYMTGSECNTTACRRLAARMLDMMDLGEVDPCQDFYQYSCGGVVDDPFLDPEDPKVYANALIKESLESLLPNDTDAGAAKVFYDGCLNYTRQTEAERIKRAREVFLSLGYSFSDDTSEDVDLTQLLSNMMKMHFTPLFDLTLDVDEDDPSSFVLRLSPPVFTSPFSDDLSHSVCVAEYKVEAAKAQGGELDLDEKYKKYTECLKTDKGFKTYQDRLRESVQAMQLRDGDFLDDLLYNIVDFNERILPNVPEEAEARKTYLNKGYKMMTLDELMKAPDLNIIRWNDIASDLLPGGNIPLTTMVYVYFKENLTRVFEELGNEEPLDLQNMLLMQWSERVYSDLVSPHGVAVTSPDYCFRVTKALLPDLTSFIYLKSLSDLNDLNTQINTMVRLTKKMAEKQIEKSTQKDPLLEKLEDMVGVTAELKNVEELMNDTMKAVIITGNFTNDCRTLLQRLRTIMYKQYYYDPRSPKTLWSHFLLPHSSHGIYLYPINKFMIPYGAAGPPLFYKDVPQYVNFAGLGHMIAHEVMHGFDLTATKLDKHDQISSDAVTCLGKNLLSKMNISGAPDAVFTPDPELVINELLSDSAATRLAWEAYLVSARDALDSTSTTISDLDWEPEGGGRGKREALARLEPESKLPFLTLTPMQIYFLRTAQTQCTASSEIPLSVKESEYLPARLRVNMILQNEPLFKEAFECKDTSAMVSQVQCPYTLG